MFNHGWWRLAVGGWWRLPVGGWWLAAVGGGWQLVMGGWWRLAAVDGWRLVAVGGGWRLAAVGGGWRRLAVGGSWRIAVGGPLGRSLRAVLNKKKIWSLKDRPALRHPFPRIKRSPRREAAPERQIMHTLGT